MIDIRRREFVTLLGGTVAWPLAARAQQMKVYRVGALLVGNADADSFQKELREELRKAGYVEGQNLVLEFRSAEEKLDLLPKLAAELVALKVDVILALYTPCAIAAQKATREIPIVIMSGGDKPQSSWRKYHRRFSDGWRVECQICRAGSRHLSNRAPRRRSRERG
jgi:putative tryptophan/tyrosine transport system substrate-binding protein